ncbi:toll/interleukin-1 receptor domain-containing protein (plasmid) [Priestia megaterium]|uniref:toll/interleukin-1 receptor domain-containing protein n=1 Tax=Priestia megaterium TaxID=1404 RepID=UPI003D0832FD
MNALKRLAIEVDGIYGTITDYSSEAYVKNIVDHLKSSVANQDIEQILYLLNKVDDWYRDNINEINNNQFVFNHKAHRNTWENVKIFKEELIELNTEVSSQIGDSGEVAEMTKKIFISHSSKDEVICSAFVELLETIGIADDIILYTSSPRHGIPGDRDIFNYLRDHLSDGITVFYMLSDNYYNSTYCLNEMGAAWVAQNDFSTFLLPNFSGEIEGVIDRNKKAFRLEQAIDLINLKNKLVTTYSAQISEAKWEDAKNKFLKIVNEV